MDICASASQDATVPGCVCCQHAGADRFETDIHVSHWKEVKRFAVLEDIPAEPGAHRVGNDLALVYPRLMYPCGHCDLGVVIVYEFTTFLEHDPATLFERLDIIQHAVNGDPDLIGMVRQVADG